MDIDTKIMITLVALITAYMATYSCQQCEKTKQEALKAGLVEKVVGHHVIWGKPEQ